jgi:hypothetical protein
MVSHSLRNPALRLCGSPSLAKCKCTRRWAAPCFAERHSVTRPAVSVHFGQYRAEWSACPDTLSWKQLLEAIGMQCFDLGFSRYWGTFGKCVLRRIFHPKKGVTADSRRLHNEKLLLLLDWLYSPCGPWTLFSFLIYSQSVGFLGRVLSPLQGHYLNTGQHKHRINTYTHQRSMP